MSIQTDKSLFIVSSVPRLYQHLFTGMVSYRGLASHIISQIKAAHGFRRIEQVRELSTLLLNIPIKEYRLIGEYYLYWCGYRNGEYDIASLEAIIDQTQTYKAQALLSRGAFEYDRGRYSDALYFFTEALKAHPTVTEHIAISIAIAVVKSADGLHSLALADLENLVPIIGHAEPRLYFDFLNSYAVELGEAGRKQEARNISRIVLASPFAYAYPEWQATANDLRGSSRSLAVINPPPYVPRNVLFMPVTEQGKSAARFVEPARVLDLQKWKNKMGKGKKRNGEKASEALSGQEMLMRIMQFYVSSNTTDEQRRKIYEYALKVLSEPAQPDAPGDDSGA